MGKFDLNSDDVVSSIKPGWDLMASPTFKIEQIQQVLANQGRLPSIWFEQGVTGEVLNANQGGGWKKGTIRIRFEFIEDEPSPESPDL